MMASENERPVVVITGSSGFVGSAVVRRLAARYRVVGVDREGGAHPPIEAECVCADLSSAPSVSRAFDRIRYAYGKRIASVVHLAAYYDFSGRRSPLYERITIEGTLNLLGQLSRFAVEQLAFSSTMLVHRPARPGERIREESPLGATWAYPESKTRAESLIRSERGEVPAVLLRIAGVYDDMGHSIPLANHIQRVSERWLTARFYPGDLDAAQAFVHLDDLVDAIEMVVDSRGRLPEETALLIGEESALSFRELQREISILVHGFAMRTWRIPGWLARWGSRLQAAASFGAPLFIQPWMIDRAGDRYLLDVSRARELLGWRPRHSLRRSLATIVGHLLTDPVRFYQENHLAAPGRLSLGTGRSPGRLAMHPDS